MKEERKFLRRCCNCYEYKEKKDLIKITKNSITNEIRINNDNGFVGRSVYICKNEECVSNAIKKKKIENSLKSNISESIKEELSTVLKR